MKLPWCQRSFDLPSWFVLLCCPDLAPTPALSRTASCPWSLHPQAVPAVHAPLISLALVGWATSSERLWQPWFSLITDRNRLTEPCHSLAKPGKTLRCWSVRTRHLKLVLIHLIWFISGLRRSTNGFTFLLWYFCLDLSINTSPSHCCTKMRGQRARTFPRYKTLDYSAPSWKGDEKGYPAMRSAPLNVCLDPQSNGDVSQMHHCWNNGALILYTKKMVFGKIYVWSQPKSTLNTAVVQSDSLPGQGTPSVLGFVREWLRYG